MAERPRIRVSSRGGYAYQTTPTVLQSAGLGHNGGPRLDAQPNDGFRPFNPIGSAASFESAGQGRRLANFNPSRAHVNAAIQFAGRTIVKRMRFLVENNAYVGRAVDLWAAWMVGDGITPIPRIKNKERRAAIKRLWRKWAKEADAEGLTNFSGIEEAVVRELATAGECFVRRRKRRPGDTKSGIPFQCQVLPSEMLDLAYNVNFEGQNVIRMGVEFDAIGRRVAYHFWKVHPDDYMVRFPADGELRTRVPAEDVIHVIETRQAGQIRGVPKMARMMVKTFMLDVYDDAELDRKKTAALYAGFVTKQGEKSALDDDEDDEGDVPLEPGAMVVLNEGEDITFSNPADVGGSYEPFQYRTLLQISVGANVPYAYLTGDTTKGNFSNVRTEIVNFRRSVLQFQGNRLIPQLCERVWEWFETGAQLAGLAGEPDEDDDTEWLAPKMEWIDPAKDVKAEIHAIRGGLSTRTKSLAARGEDREDIDDELQRENADADERGLILDTDPRRVSAVGMSNAMPTGSGFLDPDDELPDPQDVQDASEEAAKAPPAAPAAPKKQQRDDA